MWRKFIKDYFTFTRKDRLGVLALLSLILFTLVLPAVFPTLRKPKSTLPDKETAGFVQSLSEKSPNKKTSQTNYTAPAAQEKTTIPYRLFYFDPNTATIEEWVQLGVREKTAISIQKYISKGGKFRNPDDIRKVYTLSEETANRLIPYVRIQAAEQNNYRHPYAATENSRTAFSLNPARDSSAAGGVARRFSSGKTYRYVDINLSDTSDFQTFPGIGNKMAQRILSYRERLGGFVSIDQVSEVWPLPDSVFQKIRPWLQLSNTSVRKININSATLEILRSHPYFNYSVANTLIQYRTQHGDFKSVQEINKIQTIDEELFRKLLPYLTID